MDGGEAASPRGGAEAVSRRGLLRGSAAALAGTVGFRGGDLNGDRTQAKAADGPVTTFEALDARARAMAAAPYAPPADDLPEALRRLSYDGYRAIRPLPERALGLGSRFSAQAFHRGFLHGKRVGITVQPRAGGEYALPYEPGLFDLGRALAGQTFPTELGFAGFRLHHSFDGPAAPTAQEEFLVFLGAAYFRLRGRRQEYGLSGRGVAVNTGLARPEEFPDFTAFWIAEPAEGEAALTVMALLDGPSLSGAFRFRVAPGEVSHLDVEARLHPRGPIERLGLAPLTSMFLHGKAGPDDLDDFRPEVHDSDGLLFTTAEDGTCWRPLVNRRPPARVTPYPTRRLERFALLQRERRFPAYLDVQARHEERPGLVVEPRGDWGPGEVQLFEIPSREEYADNIVASFVPREPVTAGRPLALDYTLATVGAEPPASLARVVSTRIGSPDRLRPVVPPVPGRRYYVVDFEGGALPGRSDAPVMATVATASGTVVEPVVERVPQTGGWRLYLEHRPGEENAEISAYLTLDGALMTEIWRYRA